MKKLAYVFLILALGACEGQRFGSREKAALAGGALGAGLGAIVGNQTGSTGAGIAIGATAGALSGALIGNELDNQDDELALRQQKLEDQQRQLDENRRLIDDLKRGGVDARITDRGVVVNIPDVLFDFDSARLNYSSRDTVSDIARIVNQSGNRRVSVEGHTDSIGTEAYNRRLSSERARSVAGALTAAGVSRRRLESRGLGESDPVASNHTEAGRQRNRRVEVIIENR